MTNLATTSHPFATDAAAGQVALVVSSSMEAVVTVAVLVLATWAGASWYKSSQK